MSGDTAACPVSSGDAPRTPYGFWQRETRGVADDEKTVPDRHTPPSRRDLSTHEPECNCMGCYYRESPS